MAWRPWQKQPVKSFRLRLHGIGYVQIGMGSGAVWYGPLCFHGAVSKLKSIRWRLAEFYYDRGRGDRMPALASSCKKQLTGFFVCLLFFLKVRHIN